MDKFVETLKSPVWWIGVVLVGILINIASAYLKPRLDKLLARVSRSIQERNEKSSNRRKALVNLLIADPHKQTILANHELRCRIRSHGFHFHGLLLAGIGALFHFVVASHVLVVVFWTAAVITELFSINDFLEAMRIHDIVDEVNPDLHL